MTKKYNGDGDHASPKLFSHRKQYSVPCAVLKILEHLTLDMAFL